MGTCRNVSSASIKMSSCLQCQRIAEFTLGYNCKARRRSQGKTASVWLDDWIFTRTNLSCLLSPSWTQCRFGSGWGCFSLHPSHAVFAWRRLLPLCFLVYRSFDWSARIAASFAAIIILCDHAALSHIKGSSGKTKSQRGSCSPKDSTLSNVIELQN